MPFSSKAQQRYMFATKPKVAKEMSSKMTSKMFENLPEKSQGKKKTKMHLMLEALGKMSQK